MLFSASELCKRRGAGPKARYVLLFLTWPAHVLYLHVSFRLGPFDGRPRWTADSADALQQLSGRRPATPADLYRLGVLPETPAAWQQMKREHKAACLSRGDKDAES